MKNFIKLGMAAAAATYYYSNRTIQNEFFQINFPQMPIPFSDMKIVHLSDLHGQKYGTCQNRLIQKIRNQNPDFIFMTGDFIDEKAKKNQSAYDLVKGCTEIATTYFVSGNHEDTTPEIASFFTEQIKEMGVHVLDDEIEVICRNNQEIVFAGYSDHYRTSTRNAARLAELKRKAGDRFTVLLSHRPEELALYSQMGFSLVFSGHAHGGQIRLPGIPGLYAPGQGLFPVYTSGLYQMGKTRMIVSRGLGGKEFPFRVGNRPHLPIVQLYH